MDPNIIGIYGLMSKHNFNNYIPLQKYFLLVRVIFDVSRVLTLTYSFTRVFNSYVRASVTNILPVASNNTWKSATYLRFLNPCYCLRFLKPYCVVFFETPVTAWDFWNSVIVWDFWNPCYLPSRDQYCIILDCPKIS